MAALFQAPAGCYTGLNGRADCARRCFIMPGHPCPSKESLVNARVKIAASAILLAAGLSASAQVRTPPKTALADAVLAALQSSGGAGLLYSFDIN